MKLTGCEEVSGGLDGSFPQPLFQAPAVVNLGRIRREAAPGVDRVLEAARQVSVCGGVRRTKGMDLDEGIVEVKDGHIVAGTTERNGGRETAY